MLISVTIVSDGGNFLKITWHVTRSVWCAVNSLKLPTTSRRYRKADRFGAVRFKPYVIVATIGSHQANEKKAARVRYHLVRVRCYMAI